MSGVRVLVGTRKGAFVLTSDGKRERWDVSGPHFAGWEIYHLKGSPVDPNRLYASQSSGWFGQMIQRSDDGGKTWEPVGNKFVYDGVPGTHQWYDGTPHPWEFKRVWHLEPSLTDPGHRLRRGGRRRPVPLDRRRPDVAGASRAARPRLGALAGSRAPAGCACTRSFWIRAIPGGSSSPSRPRARSGPTTAARPGGRSTAACKSEYIPDPDAEVGHCVHRIAMHPSRPNVLFMQKHWDVMRSDDAGESWHEVSGNLPTDFGFPIDVHAHEPDTIYVVPIKSDSEHYPPEGKLRVYRSRTGGNEWEALTNGLPQERLLRQRAARRDGRRLARFVRRLFRHHRRAGVRLGRRRRQLGAHRPGSSGRAVRRGPDAAMIRVVLPAHLRTLARVDGEVELDVEGPVTQRSVLDALEARYPMLRGTIRDHVTQQRRPFVRFFACEQDLSHEPPDAPLPDAVATGAEPFLVVGAIAGG